MDHVGPKHFRSFVLGQVFPFSFSISQEDVLAFAELTRDRNPLHTDPVFAREIGPFCRTIAHGLGVASRVVGAMDELGLVHGTCKALMDFHVTRFRRPVFPGDELSGDFRVTELRPREGGADGIVSVEWRVWKTKEGTESMVAIGSFKAWVA